MICLNKNGTSTLSNLDPINSDTAMRTLILNLGLSLGHMVLNNDRIMNNSEVDTFLPNNEYEESFSFVFTGFGVLVLTGFGLTPLGPGPSSSLVVLVNVRIGDCLSRSRLYLHGGGGGDISSSSNSCLLTNGHAFLSGPLRRSISLSVAFT